MSRLSPESQALFDVEREATQNDGVPDALRARLRSDLIARVAAGTAVAAATTTVTTTLAAKAAAHASTAAVAEGAAVVATTGAAQGVLGVSIGKLAVGLLVAGTMTWGASQLSSGPEARPGLATAASVALAPAEPPAAPLFPGLAAHDTEPSERLAPEAEEVSPAPSAPPSPARVDASSAASPETVNEQAALLLEVRAAMGRGQYGEAQRLLRVYRERYGDGALAEDQHALTVMATCGQDPAAGRAAALRFHARFPRSPLRSHIDKLCGVGEN